MKSIFKLKNQIEQTYDSGKLPRGISSLYSFRELEYVFSYLSKGKSVEFINSEVYNVLTRYGISVTQKGIGWLAQ